VLLLMLSGCDNKAQPVEEVPEEIPQEKYEKGHIDTHSTE
jgi:hypothetical protein